MLFSDYHFSTAPNCDAIFFDEELTAAQLGVKPGDRFVTIISDNGQIMLRKVNLSIIDQAG